MEEVVQFLSENPVIYFGTTDQEGNPKVRPFQFMLVQEGKLYFCTSNEKKVYQEIQHNPRIEICTSSPQFAWLRLSGEVVFTDDLQVKAAILESSPLVKSIYQTPDNPIFEAFYLDNAEAVITDFSGQPPKTFKL